MKTILIVDDESVVREVLKLTVEIGEFRVLQAQNAREAIQLARVEKPDIIIMDVIMPGGMDGLEATRIIKQDPETRECQVLILTGQVPDKLMEKSLEVGATDCFRKPFSPIELLRKIDELISD